LIPQRSRAISPISPTSDRIYATVKAQAGYIDLLAVNAEVYEFGTLGEITKEQFDQTFNTDVRGLLFTVQKALPLLTRGSSVILTGSMVSIKGFASCSVYNAAKAAVRSFARTSIVDLKGRDIRVNVLSPGYTDTPGLSHFVTDQEKAAMVASVPLGGLATPDDLGKAAVFLASDDSAYVTGIEPVRGRRRGSDLNKCLRPAYIEAASRSGAVSCGSFRRRFRRATTPKLTFARS
jgi:NAD(P)-dependent dehydrogenase (short-subunit alcohol dehydrogenase family)